MTARRTLGAAVLALAPVLGAVLVAQPAQAHGAMAAPISRVVACGPEGGAAARSPACRAAVAANGGTGFADFDNLRVPGVDGRDRQRIPDGRLCSGGLSAFKGLDLARSDWPATTLTPGTRYTFRYRVTIPHQGSFRLYVSRAGYLPTRPLRWADLAATPFVTVTDPPIRDGAYVFTGTLPVGLSGRQMIYTIWQTTSTPDTYYSCSDVVFAGAAGSASAASAAPAGGSPAPAAAVTDSPSPAPARAAVTVASAARTRNRWPLTAIALGAVAAAGAAALRARRRRT